jgi:hypothetical protein
VVMVATNSQNADVPHRPARHFKGMVKGFQFIKVYLHGPTHISEFVPCAG